MTAAADTDCKGKNIVEGETKKGFRFTYFYRYFFFINVTGVEILEAFLKIKPETLKMPVRSRRTKSPHRVGLRVRSLRTKNPKPSDFSDEQQKNQGAATSSALRPECKYDSCLVVTDLLITWRNLHFFARLRQLIALLFGAIVLFY